MKFLSRCKNKFLQSFKKLEKQIIEILKYFNIGNLKKFENLSGGYCNVVIKIKTTRGIFVLKIYKNNWQTKKKLENISQILYDLKLKVNFPVAKPIKNKLNKFVIQIDKKLFEISEFVEGETYDNNFKEEKMINAAKALAQLHKETQFKSTKNLKSICFHLDYFESLWDSKKGNYKNKISISDRIFNKKKLSIIDKKILEKFIPFVKEQLKLLKNNLKYVRKIQNLSQIHNDYYSGQIIFNNNDIAAIIDFESMKEDYAMYDLVKSTQAFTLHLPKKESTFNFDRLKLFLDSYKEVFGKIDLEPQEVLAFLRQGLLGQLTFWIEKLFESQNEDIIKKLHISNPINKLKWVSANEKTFTSFFCEVRK